MMMTWQCWCDVFRHCLHALLDVLLLCRTWFECVDSLKPLACALLFLRFVIDHMLSITIVLLNRISGLLGMTHVQSVIQRQATMEKSVVALQALLDVPHRLTSFVMQEVGLMWKHLETNHLCTFISLNLWLITCFWDLELRTWNQWQLSSSTIWEKQQVLLSKHALLDDPQCYATSWMFTQFDQIQTLRSCISLWLITCFCSLELMLSWRQWR